MAGRGKQVLGLALALIVGTGAGLGIGGYWGFQRGFTVILNEALTKDARAVQSHVVTLKHLRAGEQDQAAESLEGRLDDELILFDPTTPYSGLTAETTSEVKKAIYESREYRTAYARKSNRPFVDEMIKNLFARSK